MIFPCGRTPFYWIKICKISGIYLVTQNFSLCVYSAIGFYNKRSCCTDSVASVLLVKTLIWKPFLRQTSIIQYEFYYFCFVKLKIIIDLSSKWFDDLYTLFFFDKRKMNEWMKKGKNFQKRKRMAKNKFQKNSFPYCYYWKQ